MQAKPLLALALAAAAIALAAPQAAAQAPALRQVVAPHRAVYDIKLARSDEGSGVSTASGRMVFEITGGACEGYRMRQRMVVNIGDEAGKQGRLDFRITTFESPDGAVYNFDSRTTMNDDVMEAVEGEARRLPDGIEVKLKQPGEKTVRLDSETLFPSQHMQAILDAASAKRTFMAAEIYEGSGDGQESDAATAVIGGAQAGSAAGPLRDGVRHWPVSVGYFGGEARGDDEGIGEDIPSYQMRFTLYENGVTNDLVMDYGDYALSGALQEIEPLAPPECAAP